MTARDGMTIARPLMGLKKRDLIAFAEARGTPFIDDPSNSDPRFARTRLRALLARLDEEGLNAEALDRLARRARETEEALAHLTAEVETQVGAEGAIDARALFAAPIAIAHRILARRIAEAGGRDATPHRAREDRNAGFGFTRRAQRAAGSYRQCRGRACSAHREGSPDFRARAAPGKPQAIGGRRCRTADWLVAANESVLSNLKHLRRD